MIESVFMANSLEKAIFFLFTGCRFGTMRGNGHLALTGTELLRRRPGGDTNKQPEGSAGRPFPS
jgi:hypothetical protein